ncbi:MAG: hypothetical protein LBF54_03745 [Holosporaceae bacterium]|nr:hypothetical protein [Holosporaceae bacterium]
MEPLLNKADLVVFLLDGRNENLNKILMRNLRYTGIKNPLIAVVDTVKAILK